ncbi:MAG TPA: hypothetical protein DEO88_15665 [Syntrophobacteraceae bacterium]|nr:hypothetical protein [Syntrophobacteraceae bacterium]
MPAGGNPISFEDVRKGREWLYPMAAAIGAGGIREWGVAVAKRRAGKQETGVGIAVLLVLAGVASWVVFRQAHYDPEPFRVAVVGSASLTTAPGTSPATAAQSTFRLQDYCPEGLTVMSPAELFEAADLSDKIDGKAELYLSAGFVSLTCQRYSLTGHPASWLEVYLFDMGEPRNAFAVFSSQRRADGEALPLARHAYRTANALFFVHGRYYVEIVAAQAGDEILSPILVFAENLVRQVAVEQKEALDGPPFPPEDLDKTSITLLASDVFGFDGLSQVYTAVYQTAAGPMTAFFSERTSTTEAKDLAASYCRFLVANGGVDKPSSADVPGMKVLQVFDSFEVIVPRGRYLLGVHDASAYDAALQLAQRLYQAIPENVP